MAVIEHDHSYLKSEPSGSKPVHGLVCMTQFLAFWVVFLTAVWALHAVVEKFF